MPSIRNIIITQPLKIQTLSSIVSTLNFATHILPQSQYVYHQGNPSHRQSIMNMYESSHSKRQSKSKSCSQSCLSSTSTSVSTPSPSLSSSSSTPTSFTMITDIEDIHTQAIQAKAKTYIDPSTGFTVFTEYAHLKRGRCCGNMCRHCPYGWENVTYEENGELVRRQAKVKSGDRERVKILLDRIENESECKGDNEITDFTTNNVNDGESTKTQLTIINVEKSQHVPTNTNTASSHSHNKENEQFINTTEANLTDKVIYRGKGGRKGGTFTSKNVPYTRSGDEGTSMLLTGERRSKDDVSFEAMGTVDELCSVVGVAHAELLYVSATKTPSCENSIDYGELDDWLLEIMSRLFDVGSHVAKPKRKRVREENTSNCDFQDDNEIENSFTPDGIGGGFDEVHIDILEEWIDILTERLPELTSFVLPTGGKASAQLHFARCVCRRAERRVLPLVREGVCDPNTARYLNRLSDFLFTAARWCNFCEGKEEVQYRRYFRGATQRDDAFVFIDPFSTTYRSSSLTLLSSMKNHHRHHNNDNNKIIDKTKRKTIQSLFIQPLSFLLLSSSYPTINNAACLSGDTSIDCIGTYKVPIDDSPTIQNMISTPEQLKKYAPDIRWVPTIVYPKNYIAAKDELIQLFENDVKDMIPSLVNKGELILAGVEILRVVPRITVCGRVILSSLNNPNNDNKKNKNKNESNQNDFSMKAYRFEVAYNELLGNLGSADVLIGQSLNGQLGSVTMAQIQILDELKNAIEHYDEMMKALP